MFSNTNCNILVAYNVIFLAIRTAERTVILRTLIVSQQRRHVSGAHSLGFGLPFAGQCCLACYVMNSAIITIPDFSVKRIGFFERCLYCICAIFTGLQ